MRAIASDEVAWSVGLSVCWLHLWALQKPMSRDAVWRLTQVGPKTCIRRGPDSPKSRGNFWGYPAHWKVWGVSGASCIKTAESIEMPFLDWLLRARVLEGGQDRTNPFATASGDKSAMRPFVELLWPLVNYCCLTKPAM